MGSGIDAATLRSWLADGEELAVLDPREQGDYFNSHLFHGTQQQFERQTKHSLLSQLLDLALLNLFILLLIKQMVGPLQQYYNLNQLLLTVLQTEQFGLANGKVIKLVNHDILLPLL